MAKIIGAIVAGITAAIIAFVVMLFVIKALWAWTIPDLFPGAVAQGLVAGSISWVTSIKVAILVAIVTMFSRGHHASD